VGFQVAPLGQPLHVEGRSEQVGEFSGLALAFGVQDTDPIVASGDAPVAEAEGLEGFGRTYFLVADPDKPAPVWVAKSDVERHRCTD